MTRVEPGDVVRHSWMCEEAGGYMLQAGMNFRPRGGQSVFLMSVRPGAPYEDVVQENGRVLIYEGHDVRRSSSCRNPKEVDQPAATANGRPTQNGLFYTAAMDFKSGKRPPELIRVYEKVKQGIWVYGGVYELHDAWQEPSGGRKVFKFRLELARTQGLRYDVRRQTRADRTRVIPTSVKQEVWRRDKGCCAKCGSKENLHFDHIIPYSKGGASDDPKNIQLLCAKHNLAKHDRIEYP